MHSGCAHVGAGWYLPTYAQKPNNGGPAPQNPATNPKVVALEGGNSLLPDDRHFFVDNSPLAHAQHLRGHLLLVHGTGDDNVHYNNCEQLINELIKYNKTFQLMSYPNRTHSLSEGEGTSRHLASTFTKFLQQNCPPGGR